VYFVPYHLWEGVQGEKTNISNKAEKVTKTGQKGPELKKNTKIFLKFLAI